MHGLADVAGASADLLLLARLRAGLVPGWAAIVSEVRARGEPVARKDLAIGGDDLLRIGIPPGPGLGVLLDRLLLLVLDDPALNQRDVLLKRAKDLA